jgi:hypothetical protein
MQWSRRLAITLLRDVPEKTFNERFLPGATEITLDTAESLVFHMLGTALFECQRTIPDGPNATFGECYGFH